MTTIDITGANIDDTIEANEIVLIDWWADWCGPCKMFAPTYEKVSNDHPDVTFAKVDTEANKELSAAAGIQSIPTLMVFRQKVLVFSQAGALNEQNLTGLIAAVKDLDMDAVREEQRKAREIMKDQQ